VGEFFDGNVPFFEFGVEGPGGCVSVGVVGWVREGPYQLPVSWRRVRALTTRSLGGYVSSMKMMPRRRMKHCRMPVRYSVQRQPREGWTTTAAETMGPNQCQHYFPYNSK
jgi:hypothetical protein